MSILETHRALYILAATGRDIALNVKSIGTDVPLRGAGFEAPELLSSFDGVPLTPSTDQRVALPGAAGLQGRPGSSNIVSLNGMLPLIQEPKGAGTPLLVNNRSNKIPTNEL